MAVVSPELRTSLDDRINDANVALDVAVAAVSLMRTELALAEDYVPADPPPDPDPNPDPPDPVTAPEPFVIAETEAGVELGWTGQNADEFQVYVNSNWSADTWHRVPGTATNYVVTHETRGGLELVPGQQYTFRMSALKNGEYTPWGPTVSGMRLGSPTPPDPDPPPSGAPLEQRPFPNSRVYLPGSSLTNVGQSAVAEVRRGFNFATGGDSPPVYVGKSSDPTWTLNIEGRQFTGVRAPSNITPGSGTDGPLVILDDVAKIEYRMWQASVNATARTVSCNGGGVGRYDTGLGRAEIHGQNTGSGNSYTVGMIRPYEIGQKYIDHGIRVAIQQPALAFVDPAIRYEAQNAQPYPPGIPMGMRILFPSSPAQLDAAVADGRARVSDPLNKDFVETFLRAMPAFGLIALDGTSSGDNIVYLEGSNTADWTSVAGPRNSSGSYNHVARAARDAMTATGMWDRAVFRY